MAVSHIPVNQSVPFGNGLVDDLSQLEGAYNRIKGRLASMSLMIDGDSGQAANYTEMQQRVGLESNEDAKAAFDELNSAMFKLGTNASVTDVNAALLQVFNKFRQ